MLRACLFLALLGGCAGAPPPAPRTVEHIVIVTPQPVAPPPHRKMYRRPVRHTVVGIHPSHAPGHTYAQPPRRHSKPPRRHGNAHGRDPSHHDCAHPSHGSKGSKGSHGKKDRARRDEPHEYRRKRIARPAV